MQLKSEILVLSNKFQRANEKIAMQSKLVQLWYSLETVNIFPWKTLYFMLMHKAHDSFVPVTSRTQCSHLPICHSISNLEIFIYPRLKQPPKLKHYCKLEVYFSRSANWPFSEQRQCFRVIFGWHACRNEASWCGGRLLAAQVCEQDFFTLVSILATLPFLGVHAWLMLFNTDFFHLGKAVFTSCGQLIAFWISCSLGRAVTVLLAARCSNMNCLLRMLFQWNIPSYCNWLVMPTVHWSTTHFHLVKARFFPKEMSLQGFIATVH